MRIQECKLARSLRQFGVETYEKLPDVLNSPDKIKSSKGNHFEFYKTINGERYVAVVKILEHVKELYMQSFRRD